MEFNLDELINLLLNLKKEIGWNRTASIYVGNADGSGFKIPYDACLCAEETYKGVNIPLFKIPSPTNCHEENVEHVAVVSPFLKTDREDADKQEELRRSSNV